MKPILTMLMRQDAEKICNEKLQVKLSHNIKIKRRKIERILKNENK